MTNPVKLTRGAILAITLMCGVSPLIGVEAVQAQSQQLIASVLFTGNSAFSDAQLLTMVNVAERGSFTESGVQSDAESIRQAYLGKGFDKASVTSRLEPTDSGRTRITFVINEGERTGIAAINFTGNNAIGSGSLKSIIRTHETGLFSWLFRDDTYSEDQLQVDRGLIELYYMNHGYPDAQVTSAVGEFDAARNAYFVNFTINEGQRYRFGSIGVESSIPGINSDALSSTVRTSMGETYSFAEISRSQEDMAAEAAAQGFAFADVRPRVERVAGTDTFNITYLVDQGPRLYVERINIVGNDKTRDAVIRRELDFGEGDPFNRSVLQRGKTAIEGLGFFKVVNIDLQPGSASDKVIINVSVEEQSTGEYGLTAGYASDSGILGEVSVTERNFLGRGQYVRASINTSESGKSFDFSFTEPRFMGLHMSSGFDIYHRVSEEGNGNVFGTESTGGQLRLGVPLTRDVNLTGFIGAETEAITDDEAPVTHLVDASVDHNKAWIGYTLSYNGLDSAKHPTEGLTATLTQQYIGLDYNLIKTEAKARYYMPLLADANIIGSIKGQAGIVNSLDGEPVNTLEAFRHASTLVRGFVSGSMGPKYRLDPSSAGYDELLGFTSYAAASVEVEFPIPVLPESYGVRGAVWADAAIIDGQGGGIGGAMTATTGSTDSNFKSSVGASVIWDSPFGPLRGDFAYVLDKATDDKTQVFQLTLQQSL
jgi:outer membrane protein insertion porin family